MEFKALFSRRAQETKVTVSPEELKLAEMILAARGVIGKGLQRDSSVSAVCHEINPGRYTH
ncbi:MAG: hypothetical protein ACK4NR_07035 [Micavibrio sp.]